MAARKDHVTSPDQGEIECRSGSEPENDTGSESENDTGSESDNESDSELEKSDDTGSDSPRVTLLHKAARRGNVKKFREALETADDVNPNDRYGDTPLHHAAERGCLPIVKLITQSKKYTYKNPSNREEVTPLHFAAQRGDYKIVKLILAGAEGDATFATRGPPPEDYWTVTKWNRDESGLTSSQFSVGFLQAMMNSHTIICVFLSR